MKAADIFTAEGALDVEKFLVIPREGVESYMLDRSFYIIIDILVIPREGVESAASRADAYNPALM